MDSSRWESTLTDGTSSELLTIGAMAGLCGVTVRTLRYYETLDLIGPSRRTEGKYRLYSHRAVKRIRAISALQDLNYSLEEILQILGPYSKSLTFNKQDQIVATRTSLTLQRTFVESKLRTLAALKDELDSRLAELDAICQPCVTENPANHCEETCHHRRVHVD